MLDNVVWDTGDMPPLIRDGMDTKFLFAKPVIEEYSRLSGKQLVRIGVAPGLKSFEPLYYFQSTRQGSDSQTGYTKRDLETNLERMKQANDATTVVILN